jgi:hypothetical protein
MAMIITLPVLGNEANAADKWLAKQGRISLRDALGAMCRTVDAQAHAYRDETDPVRKHAHLLSIAEQHLLFQREIPAGYCASMAQVLFAVWCAVFLDEEEQARRERMN